MYFRRLRLANLKLNGGLLSLSQVVCVFVFVIQLTNSFSQSSDQLKFESITGGLSSNYILDICQDHDGYMWFATDNGLNRFDGESIKVYNHNPDDTSSLSHDNVYVVLVDNKKRLWVGTQSGGLNLYNRNLDAFHRFQNNPDDSSSIDHNSIRTIYEDPSGTIWIGTKGGLNKFIEQNQTFLSFTEPENIDRPQVNNVRALLVDQKGNFWVGSSGGLDLLNVKTGKFRHIPQQKNDLSDNRIRTLFESSDGTIWAGGSWSGGLKKIETIVDQTQITTFLSERTDFLSSSRNNILDINEYHGKLWVGTENGGLQLLDLESGKSQFLINDYQDDRSIGSNSIWSIFKDRDDRVWLGTYNKGISLLDPNQNNFNHQLDKEQLRYKEGNNIVTSFATVQNEVWVGTDGGGLFLLNEAGDVLDHFQNDPKAKHSLSSNSILDLYLDQSENLWIGTWGGGLNMYNKSSKKFTLYRNSADTIDVANIFSITPDDSGNLWVGSWSTGLFYFEMKSKTFTPVWYSNISDSPELDPAYAANISFVKLDRTNNLWVGGMYGLYKGSVSIGKDLVFKPVRIAKENGSDQNIFAHCMEETDDGNIWIGTVSDGLLKYNPKLDQFTRYGVKEGAAGNSIRKILKDDESNLWISTNQGLSKFELESESFKNFTKDDGLQENEFFKGSGYKGMNNQLYFGGINGFNTFDPTKIKLNKIIPPVYITGIKILNKQVEIGGKSILPKQLSELSSIELNHNHSMITLEFKALNYTNAKNTSYAYMLEGFEESWNYVNTQKYATYTNLDPGEYTFKVKAANSDGFWNEVGDELVISIAPPWWRTIPFYVVVVVLVASTMLLIIQWRNRYLQLQKKQLKKIVNERTSALTASNNQLQSALDELKDMQNKLIKSEKISALSQVVFNLLHEMNSPLGSTKAGLEYIKRDVLLEVTELPKLIEQLTSDEFKVFKSFLQDLLSEDIYYSPAEERELTNKLEQELLEMGIDDERILDSLSVINCFQLTDDVRKLLKFQNAVALLELVEMIVLKYHNLANMDKSVERSISILNSLKTYTHEETPVVKSNVDIIESIEKCLKLREHVFKRGVTLKRNYVGEPSILGVDEELIQVWLNIISNANYAMNYKGELKINVHQNNQNALITFQDNGPGIPEDKLNEVFEPFYTTKPLGEGRGIGLDIVRKIVTKHHGTISLISEPQNTQFKIEFPLANFKNGSEPQPVETNLN